MAKTRIKTTPTRMQKEAQTASAAVNSSSNRIATEHVLKKRICALNNSLLTSKEAIPPIQTSIIVQPPKRTNSISSATSTISHTSDGHCSSTESPPPSSSSSHPISCGSASTNTPTSNSNGPTMDELTENAIKTLNAGLLAKTNALALKNRKVYMITEKCDDDNSSGGVNCVSGNSIGGNCASGTVKATGQKRKMYLIMEEKQTNDANGNGLADKFMKSENGSGTKKLTLYADSTNGQLPQKIEKILPEILSCIQAKGSAATANGNGLAITVATSGGNGSGILPSTANQDVNGKPTVINDNFHTNNNSVRLKTQLDNNERLPLTLPPKKNRTKIITTQIIPVTNSNTHNVASTTLNVSNNGEQLMILKEPATPPPPPPPHSIISNNMHTANSKICKSNYTRSDISSATPVIVNATTLISNGLAAAASSSNGLSKENGNKFSATPTPPQLHKNINLSTDFLFLMKMLPKLESIAEPHKSYVKACIEDLINQYAPPGLGE
ncbi:bip1 [Musca autumnalis]|uniref:bip1 n=1 Tax=Musca autumnalis TaxID=221902 RepID=UPI003CF2463C